MSESQQEDKTCVDSIKEALSSEVFKIALSTIQAISALAVVGIAVWGIHIASKWDRESLEMANASLEWQRKAWALERTSLRIERTLRYGEDEGITGQLTITNQGQARALSVMVVINSPVSLKQDPVVAVGIDRQSIPFDQTRQTTGKYNIGDLIRREAALVEVELHPSSLATQSPLLHICPFEIIVDCENCDAPEYMPIELAEGFPKLPAGQEYTIKPGDVITDVLKPYGLTPWDLQWWNPDFDVRAYFPGQTIIIPPPPSL